ncbi:putative acyl-CoA thioester hydrolase [anaerobic digester metagenome]
MEGKTTIMTRLVMPGMLNDQGILFGGNLLKWMNETAYIAAKRFVSLRLVTVSVEKVKFYKPLHEGDILELCCQMKRAGSVLMEAEIKVFCECRQQAERMLAAEGIFKFAAVDEGNRPVRISTSSDCLAQPV